MVHPPIFSIAMDIIRISQTDIGRNLDEIINQVAFRWDYPLFKTNHLNILSCSLISAGALSRAAYHGGHGPHSTMNDLPVPAGDWKEQHSQKNAKYNAALITGILVLAGTIGFVKSSGIIHFNYYAPKSLD